MRVLPGTALEERTCLVENEAGGPVSRVSRLLPWAGTYLYSSLTPYATVMSWTSPMTALAAAFMSSRARLSLGFSNAYLFANLDQC